MGRGSYTGGGSVIIITPEGTNWETKGTDDQIIGEFFDRWDKRDDIEFDRSVQVRKRQRKQFTYFLRACARAYLAETLSPTFPPAPNFLRKQIRKAGGNAGWLASDKAALNLLARLIDAERTESGSRSNPEPSLRTGGGDGDEPIPL